MPPSRALDLSAPSTFALVDLSSLPNVEAALAKRGFTIFTLDGSQAVDAESLFAAFTSQIVYGHPTTNWEMLADRLREKLFEADPHRTAFVWRNSDRMLDRGLADLMIAAQTLTGVAKDAFGRGWIHLNLLSGRGPNFPPPLSL